jgi:type IV pilus assembly protein PilA
MQNEKNAKKNNKGFSLVELIVVIAIMAVLVGVLAPQFMGYVTRSKISTDIQNVENTIQAVNVWMADNENSTGKVNNGTSEVSLVQIEGNKTVNCATNVGVANYTLKYDKWENASITYDSTNMTWTVAGNTKIGTKNYNLNGEGN